MSPPRLPAAMLAAAVGAMVGALGRFAITDSLDTGLDFPWPVFAINVAGSALLAALPLIGAIRDRPWLAIAIGTGMLGGFTTMSTASEETVALLENGETATALLYAGGTLAAALAAAALVGRLAAPGARAELAAEEADE